jgi:hypothetical protein
VAWDELGGWWVSTAWFGWAFSDPPLIFETTLFVPVPYRAGVTELPVLYSRLTPDYGAAMRAHYWAVAMIHGRVNTFKGALA